MGSLTTYSINLSQFKSLDNISSFNKTIIIECKNEQNFCYLLLRGRHVPLITGLGPGSVCTWNQQCRTWEWCPHAKDRLKRWKRILESLFKFLDQNKVSLYLGFSLISILLKTIWNVFCYLYLRVLIVSFLWSAPPFLPLSRIFLASFVSLWSVFVLLLYVFHAVWPILLVSVFTLKWSSAWFCVWLSPHFSQLQVCMAWFHYWVSMNTKL